MTRLPAMWERLADHFSEELVARWHEDKHFDGALHEFMGLTEKQYSAWAEGRWADIFATDLECPRCFGKGLENEDNRPGLLLGPLGEDECRQCGGSGRVALDTADPVGSEITPRGCSRKDTE